MKVMKIIGVAVLLLIVVGTIIATVGCGRKYSLTINVSGQGITNPTTGIQSYGSGKSVTVTAAPASGWQFDGWSGSVSGTSTSTVVTMDSDKSITANFTLAPITIVDSSITIVSGDTYYIDLTAGYYNVSFTSDDDVTVQWLGGNVDLGNNVDPEATATTTPNGGAVTTRSYTKNNVQAYGSTTLKIYNPTGIFNNPTALLHLTIIKVK